jgi:hypothetical protein
MSWWGVSVYTAPDLLDPLCEPAVLMLAKPDSAPQFLARSGSFVCRAAAPTSTRQEIGLAKFRDTQALFKNFAVGRACGAVDFYTRVKTVYLDYSA